MMNEKVYDAFRSIGASEEHARNAAVALADTGRLEHIESRLSKLEADVQLLKWMLGTNIALTLTVLAFLLRMFSA